ncbi:DNA-methyltransferase [Cronobacter dublinensis]
MSYQIHVGLCEDVLKRLPDNSVDSIVTDPPYGLSFMGHKWDYSVPTVEQWLECLRVLKPGGHMLAFGGSRTYHRLVVNVEDAGFEVRDQILWVYGTGFPKSKNLKGDFQGWGSALKPAHEPIVLARKPLSASIEATMKMYGTGALNIQGCRVPTDKQGVMGRWPANLIHDGSEEVVTLFPANAGAASPVTGNEPTTNGFSGSVSFSGMIGRVPGVFHGDNGSAARFFYCAKVSPSERDEGMERFNSISASEMAGGRKEGSAGLNDPRAGAGRTGGARNNHPTVKPVALMKYLCRLITPPGGNVLDPWMGSGSTGRAALEEGFGFIGIEKDPDYVTVASARLAFSYKKASSTAPIEKRGEVKE